MHTRNSGSDQRHSFLAVLSAVCLLFGSAAKGAEFSLDSVHSDIVERYEGVPHLDGQDLREMNPDEVILFDVREKPEFAVSHLDGAIRLDPGADEEEFIQAHGNRLKGKTVIFYCSVGRRSSEKLLELQDVVTSSGAQSAYNLRGGIFLWSNEDAPLMQGEQETEWVHPYNFRWGRLIEDKEAISYEPQ